MPVIAPSLLAADFLRLDKAVELVNKHGDVFHLDVMDGTLVPNISFGFSIIDAVASKAEKPLDVHLMVVHPERWFERLSYSKVDMVSFHYEACAIDGQDPVELLRKIKSLGMKAGLAINPNVPVDRIFPLLDEVDYVVVMCVFAGFGGQKFMEQSYDRIRAIRAEAVKRGLNIDIEADGGVGAANSPDVTAAGATMLVAGSAVFKAENPADVISEMKDIPF